MVITLVIVLAHPLVEGVASATSPPHIRREISHISGRDTSGVYVLYSDRDLSASNLPLDIQRALRQETDFVREVAVVVFAGTRPTGGYALKVADTTITDTTFTVTIAERVPGEGAMVTQALTYPALALIIADPPGEVIVIPAAETMTQ